jgi:hypothetical protein
MATRATNCTKLSLFLPETSAEMTFHMLVQKSPCVLILRSNTGLTPYFSAPFSCGNFSDRTVQQPA